ncbi:MAG: GDP-mannose 4,6-dehydratase [Promethearchaeota archaeon]
MGRILVTGGLGFIGSNLSNYLLSETEDTIIIYDNLSRENIIKNKEWLEQIYKNNPRLQIIKADIRDFEMLKKSVVDIEKIYHIAGQVAVTTSVIDPMLDFKTNAQGTLNVLEVARRLNTNPSLILTSTNKVYGNLEKFNVVGENNRYDFEEYKQGISEAAPLDPHSPYGCSKYCADAYFKDYYRIYGLKTVVFRMSCIYGYRQFGTEDQGWVAHFIISSILNKPLTIYGDGKQIRDILFIQDLINAFQLAFKNIKTTKGEVYNIGGGFSNTISLLELIQYLEKLLNRHIGYNFSDWRPGDQKVYYSNIDKAKKDFNWMPFISKEDGIQKLFDWVRYNSTLF